MMLKNGQNIFRIVRQSLIPHIDAVEKSPINRQHQLLTPQNAQMVRRQPVRGNVRRLQKSTDKTPKPPQIHRAHIPRHSRCCSLERLPDTRGSRSRCNPRTR